VHELEPFQVEFFDRWYGLFVETVDGGWAGPIAETAKRQAARVDNTLHDACSISIPDPTANAGCAG
jgi:hypothetical protein